MTIEWPRTLPDWIHNIVDKLPWHRKDDPRFEQEAARRKIKGLPYKRPNENRKWAKRQASQIRGACFHQSWGGDDPFATNNYHTGPNHISARGCPHICYTLYINKQGEVFLCNALHEVTWSQGSRDQPGSENIFFVGVVVGGKYRTKDHPGLASPTLGQMDAIARVWDWLRESFELTDADLFGHFDFGKSACPGLDIEQWIRNTRTDSGLLVLADVDDWQRALVHLKYNLGKSGPDEDGVDGDWGPKSKRALAQFQDDYNLPRTGIFDRPTSWMMRAATAGKVDLVTFEDESLVL